MCGHNRRRSFVLPYHIRVCFPRYLGAALGPRDLSYYTLVRVRLTRVSRAVHCRSRMV